MPKQKQASLFGSIEEERPKKKTKKVSAKILPFVSMESFVIEKTDIVIAETVKPLSVSEFIGLLNERLREIDVEIAGEVSRVSFPPSGHVYFSLKDESADCVLDCVIWRSQYEVLGIRLESGMRIVAAGHADVYGPTGKLSFKARAIELTGEGILKKRYEELKKKLTAEGIF